MRLYLKGKLVTERSVNGGTYGYRTDEIRLTLKDFDELYAITQRDGLARDDYRIVDLIATLSTRFVYDSPPNPLAPLEVKNDPG